MKPRAVTEADLARWADFQPHPVVYAADDPDTSPCPAIITTVADPHGVVGPTVVRVAWQLDEVELMHLAKGGTLWLSTWGGLPPHQLEVQPPAGRSAS